MVSLTCLMKLKNNMEDVRHHHSKSETKPRNNTENYYEPESVIKRLKKRKIILLIILFFFLLLKYLGTTLMGLEPDFSGVRTGKIYCVFPDRFAQGQSSTIKANISYREMALELPKLAESQNLHTDSIRVGEVMLLKLIEINSPEFPNLMITSIGNAEQAIDTSSYISGNWEWRVTPRKSGNFKLGIKSSVLITTNQEAKYIDYPTIPYEIIVESKFSYMFPLFIKEFWLLILLLFAFMIWAYYYFKTKSMLRLKYHSLSKDEVLDFEQKLNKLVQLGEIESALNLFESLLQKCSKSTLLNKLILLKSNYNQYKSSFSANLIDYGEYNRNQAKTSKGLLELKEEIKSISKVIT